MDSDPPTDEPAVLAKQMSVATATLRALGLLAIAVILIVVLLPVAIVAAGS